MDIITLLFSAVMYVLMALGLQTIARRRGITNAWLAWVPVLSVWVLGAIADDYQARLHKRANMRTFATAAVVLTLVLAFVVLGMLYQTMIVPLADVVSFEELMQVYGGETDSVDHMYESVREDAMAQLEQRLDAALTDEMLAQMEAGLLPVTALSAVMLLTALAAVVLEYLCWYRLFASCVPAFKLAFLVASVFFGTQAIFVFACRHKDLGLPQQNTALHQGYDDPPAWQN